MKQLLILITLFLFSVSVAAQEDRLIKKNGDQFNIKVTEVSDETVKYKDYSNQNGPDFVIKRRDFVKVLLADGSEIPGISDPPPPPSEDKRGFIALNVGINSLMEDYSNIESGGIEGNLTFGYVFSRVVGISASGFINKHKAFESGQDLKCNVYGAYAGPLFSIPVGSRKKLRIHLVPYVGFAKLKISSLDSSGLSVTFDGEVTAGINSMVAWRFADMWALTGGLEARYLKITEDDMSSVKLSVGLALCF